MKRSAVTLGQALVLLVLLSIIAIQLQKNVFFGRMLYSFYPVTDADGVNTTFQNPPDPNMALSLVHSASLDANLDTLSTQQPPPHQPEKDIQLSHSTSWTEPAVASATSEVEPTEMSAASNTSSSSQNTILQVDCPGRPSEHALSQKAETSIQSIMKFTEGDTSRLTCPALNWSRYSDLVVNATSTKPKYFFAMNLYQSAHVIPQLLGAVVEAVRFLGPEHCVVSIVEGRSTDGTFEILKLLVKEMESLETSYFLSCSDLKPGEEKERIESLAELRNAALEPLVRHPGRFDPAATIVFLNDVALCAEDIIELVLQRVVLHADMTCGMDWYNLDDGEGTFYDSWIGRQINGEPFFEVPQSTSWDFSKNLFWDHETSKMRYSKGLPLQVFSCWNGAVAMPAEPFMNNKIRFRTQIEGECHLGEPVHLAKDLWKLGYGRIAVIPSVNIAYTVADSRTAKDAHGWVSNMVGKEGARSNLISWQEKPPGQIKCLEEVFHRQSWEPFSINDYD